MPTKSKRSHSLSFNFDPTIPAQPARSKPSHQYQEFQHLYRRSKIINKNLWMNSGFIEDDYCTPTPDMRINTLPEASEGTKTEIVCATFSYIDTSYTRTSYFTTPAASDCVQRLCFNVTLAESLYSSGYRSRSRSGSICTVLNNVNIECLPMVDVPLPELPVMPVLPSPSMVFNLNESNVLQSTVKDSLDFSTVSVRAEVFTFSDVSIQVMDEVIVYKSERLYSGRSRRAVGWF